MIKKEKNEYAKVLDYLKKDIENCLYLYIDIVNAHKEEADIEVWTQEDKEKIELVLLRYYDSFQIYCGKRDVNLENAETIIERYQPKMISGPGPVISEIYAANQNIYNVDYGRVYEIHTNRRPSNTDYIHLASEENAAEIAHLICMDEDLGGHYNENNLAQQIQQRIQNGTGRSYIIAEDGQIIAHTASYAETEELAVVSGTIVHPRYRDRGYYSVISNYMAWKLIEEGKRVYTFAVDPKMICHHDRWHRGCGSYGKLTPTSI